MVVLLTALFNGCVGTPCADNDDAVCLAEATDLVCNMAIPAEDPAKGTCQYPGEAGDVCAETGDCAEGACVPEAFPSPEDLCPVRCCDGTCMESPVCVLCLFTYIPYLQLCTPSCCNGDCLNNPACLACLEPLPLNVDGVCEALHVD